MALSAAAEKITVGQVFAEIVLLMAQSSRHSGVANRELPAQLLPAINTKQFHLFRDGESIVGAALWASLSEAAERLVLNNLGDAAIVIGQDACASGDRVWLLDIIAPFANASNRQMELMLGDLIAGPLKGKSFNVMANSFGASSKDVVTIPDNALPLLVSEITQRLQSH